MAIKGVKGEFGGQCPPLPSKCEDSSEKLGLKQNHVVVVTMNNC